MNEATHWAWRVPPSSALGLALLLLAAIVLILSLLGTRGRPSGLRAALLSLRAAALAGLALLLLGPTRVHTRSARAPGVVAVLVDRSGSMDLTGPGAPSRRARAADWLRRAAAPLARWTGGSAVHCYQAGGRLAGPMPLRDALEGAVPEALAAETDLIGSLSVLAERYEPGHLRAVLLLSDGQDTRLAGPALDAAALARVRRLEAPVSVVPVDTPGLQDVSIAWVQPDDLAFVRSPARVRVGLRVLGTQAPVEVRLYWDGALVDAQTVAGGTSREVALEHTPLRVGRVPLAVQAVPLPGEATPANNTRHWIQRVARDRIRVLQIAGRPSWDVRFVRQHFKRDPNVDLISFYILRTHRNATGALPSELSLIRFPAEELFREHLPTFDLVILQDFERYPPAVALYLDNLADWVRRGGGLVLLGGEHTLSAGGFYGSPLADVLPVRLLPPGPPSQLLDSRPFLPRWTGPARRHPLTAPMARPGGVALSALPPLGGLNRVAGLAPATAPLLAHPGLRTEDGKAAPLLAVRQVGRGRSAAILTDTLWHWRFRGGPPGARAYDTLWRRLVAYLLGDPGYRQVTIHPVETPGSGAPAPARAFEVRVLRPDGTPGAGVAVSWHLQRLVSRGPGGTSRGMTPVPDARGAGRTNDGGAFRLKVPPLPPGAYRLEARAGLPDGPETGARWFVRNLQRPEQIRVAASPERLLQIARATGGRLLRGPQDLRRAPIGPTPVVRRGPTTRRPVLSGGWVLFLWVLLPLGLEWALRRRAALP